MGTERGAGHNGGGLVGVGVTGAGSPADGEAREPDCRERGREQIIFEFLLFLLEFLLFLCYGFLKYVCKKYIYNCVSTFDLSYFKKCIRIQYKLFLKRKISNYKKYNILNLYFNVTHDIKINFFLNLIL